MIVRSMVNGIQAVVQHRLRNVGTVIARWTKPHVHVPVLGTSGDLPHSKPYKWLLKTCCASNSASSRRSCLARRDTRTNMGNHEPPWPVKQP